MAITTDVRPLDVPLPSVSLVGATCPKCRLQVLVVRVGERRMPMLLDVGTLTVVADTGRVMEGHPVHDAGVCSARTSTDWYPSPAGMGAHS